MENAIPMDKEKINIISDCVEAVYYEMCRKETSVLLEELEQILEAKTKPSDYEIVKNVAKGGYGEVFLVRKEKIYAMKRVSKELVLKQPHTALFMAEKEAMVDCIGSEWLVCAYLTMQDEEYLYYLMDFIPGGDFMGLLSKEDVLEEEWVRFYAAEIVAALAELHELGWIHRDLKPDNILIGADGHVKLADFGSCIRMVNGKAKSSVTVGTPDYVSPDVLFSINQECEYGEDVDFWTLGVIIYEMIYGTTPFYSDTLMETYKKITKVEFDFPFKVSASLTDLMKRLITTKEDRIGIEEIKRHSFFSGIDWTKLKELVPPFVPEINGDLDTSHFVDTHFDPEKRNVGKKGDYMPFVGFTFDPVLVSKLGPMLVSTTSASVSDTSEGVDRKTENSVAAVRELNATQSQELEKIKIELDEKMRESEDAEKKHREELREVIVELLAGKEELEEVREDLERCKADLRKKAGDVRDKQALYGGYDAAEKESTCAIEFVGNELHKERLRKDVLLNELNPFIHSVKNEVMDVLEMVRSLQSCIEKLSTENKGLEAEIRRHKERNCEILGIKAMLESENKSLGERLKAEGIDSLKRQLRLKTAEVKECEQKLDQEILFRKKIEEELSFLKKDRMKVQKTTVKQYFPCHFIGGEATVVKIEEDCFWVGDDEQHINNVYVGELKPNELHHLPQKKRPLTLRIVFMTEEVKSISSSGRRSLKSLEEDLNVELAIRDGIEQIRVLLKGKTLDEANMQLEGSNKKINQLRAEIERGRKNTMVESIPDDPVKMYEFNNHMFISRTVPQGTICDFCNEVLYGLVDQGFECRDCRMIVHKSCYVLGDVSCELYSALKTGKTYYVTMRTIEEKEKLMNMNRGY